MEKGTYAPEELERLQKLKYSVRQDIKPFQKLENSPINPPEARDSLLQILRENYGELLVISTQTLEKEIKIEISLVTETLNRNPTVTLTLTEIEP